jgi:hypothetical protein
MANWTDIPNSSIETGKPVRAVDGLAFRDNPIAITEGAAGAPRIDALALKTDSAMTDWVGDQISDMVCYDIGSYIFAIRETTSSVAPNSTVAGSSIRPVSMTTDNAGSSTFLQGKNVLAYYTGTGITGTWRCMGYAKGDSLAGQTKYGATLWLRIA